MLLRWRTMIRMTTANANAMIEKSLQKIGKGRVRWLLRLPKDAHTPLTLKEVAGDGTQKECKEALDHIEACTDYIYTRYDRDACAVVYSLTFAGMLARYRLKQTGWQEEEKDKQLDLLEG